MRRYQCRLWARLYLRILQHSLVTMPSQYMQIIVTLYAIWMTLKMASMFLLVSFGVGRRSSSSGEWLSAGPAGQPGFTGRKKRCLKSLTFPEMDLRHRNIDKANESTCTWIEEAPSYKIWEGSEGQTASERFLGIKGKPGSGKSTLMKSIIASRQQSSAHTHNYIYLAFFFNARGAIIERSPIALYKTLLYQLLNESDLAFQDFYAYSESENS